MLVHGKHFQPNLMVADNAKSLPKKGVPSRCSTRIGSARKYYTRLEKSAMGKRYNLLQTFLKYGRKKFYNIRPSLKKLVTDKYFLSQHQLSGVYTMAKIALS